MADRTKFVFPTPDACLKHFENVLIAYSLPIEQHWVRLIHNVLPPSLTDWFGNLMIRAANITWPQFKTTLDEQFGISAAVQKDSALNRLLQMKYNPKEHINKYVDRFNRLRTKAEMNDEDILKRCLLEPLPPRLFKNVSMMASVKTSKDLNHTTTSIQDIVHLLVSTYNILLK